MFMEILKLLGYALLFPALLVVANVIFWSFCAIYVFVADYLKYHFKN